MSKQRNYQTEAIVIKKIKLGEADRILTFYTPDLGKIRAVAKGVRRPKSKMAGHLELLTHSLISFVRGKNLDTVTGSQTINSFLHLKSELHLTAYAFYAIELIDQFTADHIENLSLFQLLLETMHRFSLSNDNDLILRYFEMHLFELVGYRPQLQKCLSCQRPLEPIVNSFCSSAGGMLCPDCSRSHFSTYPLSLNALKVIRLLQSSDYSTAQKLRVNLALSRELEEVMREYIKYLLEREVKSITWLNATREQARSTIPRTGKE